MGLAVLDIFQNKPIDSLLEMGAYEWLWSQEGATFKRISQIFKDHPDSLPSELVDYDLASLAKDEVLDILIKSEIRNFGVRVNGAFQYPPRLRDAADPVELLYYRGDWGLAENEKSIAIVGTRKPSGDGIRRTKKLVKQLIDLGYIIVSGLADGIDTIAHKTAIDYGGKTIAVIGTPISSFYPKQNKDLQQEIAQNHLLISQVPILRYYSRDWRSNRGFFPERNKTMSAITEGTLIIEAAETSGTLIQAKAAFKQGRKLLILKSCFENPNITWPQKFHQMGAIKVDDINDVKWGLDA